MTLSFAAIKDDVCRTVFSATYAELDAYRAATVDKFGANAETRIGQFAQWFALATSAIGDVPVEWEQWLHFYAAMTIAGVIKQDRYGPLKELEKDAATTAMTAWTPTDVTAATTSPQDPASLTMRMIYKHVLMSCVQRDPRRWPNINLINSATAWALHNLWYRKQWRFREINVSFSVSSASAVTLTPSVTVESFATRILYSTDTPGATLQYVSADSLTKCQQLYQNSAGQPKFWHFMNDPTTGALSWVFYPTPDATYVFAGWVLRDEPTLPANNNTTADFTLWPAALRPLIKDLVLARVLWETGHPDAQRVMDAVETEIERMAPQYVSRGEAGNDMQVRDVYGDTPWVANIPGLRVMP